MGKESYRSKMQYGTDSFPFAYFQDQLEHYKHGIISWHWHDEIEFVYVLEKSVLCRIGSEQIQLQSGNGIFINHNILHQFEIPKYGKMASLVFLPEFIAYSRTAIFSSFIQPVLDSNLYFQFLSKDIPEQQEILLKIHETSYAIQEESNLKQLNTYISALELWRTFFTNIIINKTFPLHSHFIKSQNHVQLMINFIEQNYSSEIKVDDIAKAANISVSEARRCFETLLQSSPLKYLTEYRLATATKLLCTTDHSISDIASDVGFNSNTYFTRLFRKKYGITPIQMKNNKDF